MLKYLKKRLRHMLGIEQNEQVLNQALKQLEFFSAYFHLAQAKEIDLSAPMLLEITTVIKKEFRLEGFNTSIHKNDLMFADHLYHHRKAPLNGVKSYFILGARIARNLETLVHRQGLLPTQILDFGSGYGRVSRFLPKVFTEAQITVSEVKEQAMDFQNTHFGFSFISHSHEPESFKSKSLFELIFALSVFTHLPKNYFKTWLTHLATHLTKGGMIVFTFNDLSDSPYEQNAEAGFQYLTHSEDSSFSFISDSISDTLEYGSTFVSKDFLDDLFDPNQFRLTFVGKTIAKNQEAAVLERLA